MPESFWTYATSGKGVAGDTQLPARIAKYFSTIGMSDMHIVLKTNTGPAIADLKRAVGRQRGDAATSYDDARAGDSNSNAKIEGTVREVKGVIRTLRLAL